jgi:arginyl-tRNA synthetase
MTINVLDCIEAIIAPNNSAGDPATIAVRRQDGPYGDIGVFPTWDTPVTRAIAGTLESISEIASIRSSPSKLSIRLKDDYVDTIGAAIEAGEPLPTASASQRHYLVGFLGANTSKALHLGHMRNLVIGNALACAFKTAGYNAESYSLVGDIGRNVCEAMAGCRLFYRDARPAEAGLKSDHFVGNCYRDYLRRASLAKGDTSDPCGREHVPADDLADQFLARWLRGDRETRELWRWICGLVEDGHAQTLKRLGIGIDRCWRESDHVEDALSLIRRGLDEDVLTRLADGMVVYDTGRDEFRRLVVARSDGFPTEHARVVSVFHRVLTHFRGGCVHIDWNGTEWEPAQAVLTLLMRSLALIPDDSVHHSVFHGMVLFDGEELSSSVNEPILIDELLDRVHASAAIDALAATAPAEASAEILTQIVIKAFFLCAPVTKPLHFSWSRLMSPKTNPGWLIARAWARASAAGGIPGRNAPAHAGPYRTAVLQALAYPRDLRAATRDLRLSGLSRFLIHCCERYVEAQACPRLDLLTKTMLARSFEGLGLSTGASLHASARPARNESLSAAR